MFGLVRKAVLFVAVVTGGTVLFFVGKSYWNKIRENPTINIDVNNPTPNVNIENIIDNVSPGKKPPRYVAYTAEETKNFKTESLTLAPDIQSGYNQVKLSPSRAFNAIFHGTPMTGKTSLARKLAKETNLPLVAVKGSDLQDRIYEQRTILDKFRALLEDLKNNPKTVGQNYILFVDEADKVGDGLNFVKDTLAEIDNQTWPNNLWIFATNYIEKIDEAVYENRERMRYKLDFSGTKDIFWSQLSTKAFIYVNDVFCEFYKESENLTSKYSTLAVILMSVGTKCDDIYNKFNFETSRILMNAHSFGTCVNSIIKINKGARTITVNAPDGKMAIGELFPQVSVVENHGRRADEGYANSALICRVLEYSLNLFWEAYKKKKLTEQGGRSANRSDFLKGAMGAGYSLENLGINIYSERDSKDILIYKAQFLTG